MLTHEQIEVARAFAATQLQKAGIAITPGERQAIEVSDFGLGDLETTGLQLVIYVNTERVCAKEIVLSPGQTCPEHRHVNVGDEPGKEETFRVRAGTVYLNVDGDPTPQPKAIPPNSEYYTARHEVVLSPGQQFTVMPGVRHWFQAGPDGAIVSEFSTRSTDEYDVFTDPGIERVTVVLD
jgi:D-lyxose ketol-isomerase